MSEESRRYLFELQRIDLRMEETRKRIADFEPALEVVDEGQRRLESEAEALRARLQELRLDERRLTLASEEKRTRMSRLQERLNTVRNLREEAAVHAEADLVRRALEADEQEAFSVMDLVQRAEERDTELSAELAATEAEVEPQRQEILAAQEQAAEELARLAEERAKCAEKVDSAALRLYDRIRSGGRSVAVSVMTEDGACGICYNVIPLQLQNEIRHGETLMRCEACGVILAPPSAAPAPAPAAGAPSAEPAGLETGDEGETGGVDTASETLPPPEISEETAETE